MFVFVGGIMALHGSTHLQSIGKLEISGVRLWVNQHNYN